MIRSPARCVVPTQHHEFNSYQNSAEDLDAFPYLKHIENIADLESQPPPPPLILRERYPGAGAQQNDYIAEPWERHPQGCLGTILQNNPYSPLATSEEFKYMQCGMKGMGMKMYYDHVLKEEHTTLHFPTFNNGDGIQKLVASMVDNQALKEWELHTLKDIRWNDNHQRATKFWSWDIIKIVRRLMRKAAYAERLIFAP